jgi:dipeptidase D
MGTQLGNLEPKRVWEFFEEICAIPRPSKKEEKIISYLEAFAREHGLEYDKDRIGNLVIRKPATAGYENRQVVILQSHVDMVCEKNSDVEHDFNTDPIIPYIKDGWIKAKGTTLGADDGIGIAVQLAILESNEIGHGPLECLFTVDEETGLTGAFGLSSNFLQGRILLNLDSEDEGELFIGCAGGIDTMITMGYEKVMPEADHVAFRISVTGLMGGHSGDDIHRGRGNANKILNRILWNCEKMYEMRLSELQGGNLRNAIPREAFATVTVPKRYKKDFVDLVRCISVDIRKEIRIQEPDLSIEITDAIMPDCLIDYQTQNRLLNALYACPHGVMAMSPDIEGLVETSTNLASVKLGREIIIATSQRSSLESAKRDVADMVAAVFNLAGAKIKHGDGYPGWTPNVNSRILEITTDAYERLFSQEPVVRAIHAGLECGLIGEKYPGMDMISYGPTIKGAHSPDERIEISTVEKFWTLTLEILKNTP